MKVLIADDTKNIRLLLTKCLQLDGYDVVCAINGKEALEFIFKENYDLIFLDIKMPEMSGTEVLKQLRKKGILTPVIIITAFPTVKNAVDCTQLGAIKYLQKPFTADRLKSVLNEIDLDEKYVSKFLEIEALVEAGDLNYALNSAKLLLSKSPENAKIYLLLSTIYEKNGDIDNCEKFKKVAKIFE